MTTIRAFIQLLLLATLLLPVPGRAEKIEGVVLAGQGPVAGAVVHAYPDFESLRTGKNGLASQTGSKPGQYLLELPAGKYYLTAQATLAGQPLHGYHGLNPITLNESYRWIPLFVTPLAKPRQEDGFQGIGGHILYKGEPLTRGVVSVYEASDAPFRGMGLLTNTLEENGKFWFDLEPGSYVVIARKRQDDAGIGPIKPGDLFCYPGSNPLTVAPARSTLIEISCYPRDDLAAFLAPGTTDPRSRKMEERQTASLRAIPAQESTTLPAKASQKPASISGRVTDLQGNPRANLYISAFPADDLSLFQMYILRFKTTYMARTDKNGNYRLDLTGGPYYLVAREKIGEAPGPREFYGLYEGTVNHSVQVGLGEEKTGVDLTVERIMP